MKRLLVVLLVAMMAVPTFQSCKKGPNDPAISLKSRDSRITATWKLNKISYTDTQVNNSVTSTYAETYDGATWIITQTGSANATLTGTFEMTIDKKGVMSYKEAINNGGTAVSNTYTGNWVWVDTDKEKTCITVAGSGNLFVSDTYVVDRLATKELILKRNKTVNNNGNTEVLDITYTFEKTK